MQSIALPGVRAVPVSENRKLGLAAATYAAQVSCPSGCPFYGKGCYAEKGHAGVTTARLNAEAALAGLTPLAVARNEAAAVAALPGLLDLRLHVVGDCRGVAESKTLGEAAGAYAARHGRKVWTYTHSAGVPRKTWGSGVSVLRSSESAAGAAKSLDLGYAPAVTLPDAPAAPTVRLRGLPSVKFIVCPYQTKGVRCTSCRLCLNEKGLRSKGLGIAFVAHGSGRKDARAATRRVGLEVL